MTLQDLIWVIIWLFIVITISAIIIITYLLGRLSIKDKPNEAFVFIKTGSHFRKPIKGKLSEVTNRGSSFMYSKGVVFVPSSYEENYYCNKRMIFVNHKGQLIASPVVDDVLLSDTEKESLIYELCASHVGADGMRALKGKDTMNILIVATVAFFIGIAVVVGFNVFQEQMNKRQATPQQQTEPSQQMPRDLEIEELK